MKTRVVLLAVFILSVLFSANASVDPMSVKIKAKSLTTDSIGVRDLAVGVQVFTNRTNMPVGSVPEGFEGYKFFTSGALTGASSVEGIILPSQAGKIYIAIRNGALSANDMATLANGGWTKTTLTFTYSTASLSIYEKSVNDGDTIPIPAIEDFRGAIPIAKTIILEKIQDTPTEADQMSVDITAVWSDNYTLLPFQNGELLLVGTNSSWTLNNVPEKYDGFKFLSSPRSVNIDGTIKASADGKIYVLAERSLTELTNLGWTQVDTCSYAASYSRLGIYEKSVSAKEEVAIPALVSWRGASPLAKEINIIKIIPADSMSITVEVTKAEENAFTKQVLNNGVTFFSDRTYVASEIPSAFAGYEFLSNGGATYERGTIIPQKSGLIYVIAKSGGLDGWEAVENGLFYYSTATPTELTIYQKKVTAGERVEMPYIQNFQGITPIAKTIDLQVISDEKEVRLDSVFVDGKPLAGFMRETDTYTHCFPYTYNGDNKPVVEAKAISSKAQVSIQGVETVVGTDDERTATIRITSQDGSMTKNYTIRFDVVPRLDLFLCIGQSNMAGYAPYDSDADLAVVNGAYLLNASNDFEPARNPMNRYSTVAAAGAKSIIGPAYSFAQSMTSRSDSPVGLIVNARGGSAIESWSKDSASNWYLPTMERVEESLKWGELKAILWHQGEANKNGDLDQYKRDLQKLVDNLRTDLGNDTLLFVAGQIGTFGLNTANFNDMIRTIPEFVLYSGCASSEGLSNIPGDNNHFDRSGAIGLGIRYAQIVADQLYLPDEVAVTIETDAGLFGKKTLVQNVDYYLSDRPGRGITNSSFSGFEGFEFLSQQGDVKEESGVIVPESDGYVYVMADKTLVIPGFSPVFGTDLYLNNGDNLCIHRRKSTAGERIEIYKTANFRGISPVAKQITLLELQPGEDARLSSLLIEGVPVNDFDKDKTDYTCYLPYTANATPEVTATANRETATIESIVPASNVTSANVTDRTTVITVKSPDQGSTKTYRIVFEVLPELDLFLCIGQSNMAGAAKLEEGDKNTIDKAFLFNRYNAFEAARNGMNRYANILTSTTEYYGLSYAFSQQIVANTNRNIGLVVNARGGSSIELWEKGGTDAGDSLYVKTMERALEAKKWGSYKAVLWHQGEADYLKVKNNGFNYKERLIKLADDLREDLGVDDLFFVVGEISHWRADNDAVNSILGSVSSYIDNAGCASAEGLRNLYGKLTADDGIQEDNHFNRESLKTFGERYAQIVLDNIYDISTSIGCDRIHADNNLTVYSRESTICVETKEENTFCSVYDITGKNIYSASVNEKAEITLPSKGVYVVKITTGENRYAYKVMVL